LAPRRSRADQLADAVDVPRHQVTTEPVAQRQRALEVQLVADAPLAQRGLGQRLGASQHLVAVGVVAVTVRHTPSWAIDSPSPSPATAIAAGRTVITSASERRSARTSAPRSSIRPVNTGVI
jgi:K+/H+ antiporter YhaU regulatory subunit KhtT